MNIIRNAVLKRNGQKPIVYDLYYKPSNSLKPVVIFCHGYKGFKDWGAWDLVAKAFAEYGFFFVKFNFSHNGGTVQQPIDFPDLEAFAQNNFTKELDDLESIINYITSDKKYATEIEVTNLNLIGHSRGGGIVIIKAEEEPKINRVVTWAGVSDFKARFQENSEVFKAWKETGRTYVENGRTKQKMPHDWQFYENFIANKERLHIKRAVENLSKPQLIVHGVEDSTVGLLEAKAISQWNPNSKFVILEEADHVFGASHPWNKETLPEPLYSAVNKTIDFLNH